MHETLSQEVLDEVGFDEIADRLGVMVTDVGARADRLVVRREGSFGLLPNETATALAMVLTELLQNAVEHGYPEESTEEPDGRGRSWSSRSGSRAGSGSPWTTTGWACPTGSTSTRR